MFEYFTKSLVPKYDVSAILTSNIVMDSMSVRINRKLLKKCQNSIHLEEEIKRIREDNSNHLKMNMINWFEDLLTNFLHFGEFVLIFLGVNQIPNYNWVQSSRNIRHSSLGQTQIP